jgi:D-alanine-D-alanine ligase
VGHLDVPFNPVLGAEHFHRDPEFLFGEGVGTSRGPLVSALYALKALRFSRKLKQLPIGVIFYTDEGRDCVESSPVLQRAMQQAARVMVLRPANKDNALILQRRGQRRYRLVMEGAPLKLGQVAAKPDVMRSLINRLDALTALSSRKERVAVAAVEMHTEAYPRMLPHRAIVTLQISYPNARKANELEAQMREILGKERATLALLSDRPALPTRRINEAFYREYRECAEKWQIPTDHASSLWPSVAGLAAADKPVLCGVGPSAHGLYTGQEKVSRISLIQQTLLLAEFLLSSHR